MYVRYEQEKSFVDPRASESLGSQQTYRFPSIDDPPTIDLSIIVPAKDEELRLPVMMKETLQYLADRKLVEPNFTWEIIIVDDGSTDKTTELALKYSKQYTTEKVRVLTLLHNRGKGGAVQLGMLSGRGRTLLFADADAATQFADLEKLQASLTKNQDTQCGFKLFTRPAAKTLFSNLHVQRWAFDVELLYLAEILNIAVFEIPVTWHEVEGSKIVPVVTWIQMGFDLVMIWVRYTFGVWKVDLKKKLE